MASYGKIKSILLNMAYKLLRIKSKLLNVAYKLLHILATVSFSCLGSRYTSIFQLFKYSKPFPTSRPLQMPLPLHGVPLPSCLIPLGSFLLIIGVSLNVTSLKWLFCNPKSSLCLHCYFFSSEYF